MLLIVCTLALSAVAPPDFKALYQRYQEAARRMDGAAYMATFTSDFVMVSPDGHLHDRAEMKKYQEVNAQTTKRVRAYIVTIESVTAQTNGDYAVIVLQKYDRDQAPLEQPDEPHNIRTSVVQRETWHRTSGGWKIRRIEEILTGPTYFDDKIVE